jgi:hypothetical protein
MEEVSKEIYERYFDVILEWFENIHPGPWIYSVSDLENTHIKLVELTSDNDKVYFRVLLKATYDNVITAAGKKFPKNFREIAYLTLTTTDKQSLKHGGTALQVCYVKLNRNNIPVNALLFTYSQDKYHRVELGIDDDEV